MLTSRKPRHRLAIALVAALLGSQVAAADDWQTAYKIGDAVQLKITDTIWQDCTVSENTPGGLLRVMCKEYIEPRPGTYSRAGGTYIAYGKSDLRQLGTASAPVAANQPTRTEHQSTGAGNHGHPGPVGTQAPTKPVATQAPSPAGGSLRLGEYACYGSGGQILAGFGFKVLAGGRYTDLDTGTSGSYAVVGDTVKFRGGHLDGTVGRALNKQNFRIGAQADCEPF